MVAEFVVGGVALAASVAAIAAYQVRTRQPKPLPVLDLAPFQVAPPPPWAPCKPHGGPAVTHYGKQLTDDEVLVLTALSSEIGFRASTIATRVGIPEARVSVARRGLAKLGLAFLTQLYDTDMGTPCGRGYLLTPDGKELQGRLYRVALAAEAAEA